MNKKSILPRERRLRVIIRDDSPFRNFHASPTYRSVAIDLTDDQMEALRLRYTDGAGFGDNAVDFHETISVCFLEEPQEEDTP